MQERENQKFISLKALKLKFASTFLLYLICDVFIFILFILCKYIRVIPAVNSKVNVAWSNSGFENFGFGLWLNELKTVPLAHQDQMYFFEPFFFLLWL